ncbi:phage tail protein I [Megamonas hypermegale]|uniref:phage tail protein I n=1 Tax=Megamonas hypermegale TaxID=158847 RepID=UPI0026EA5506|nr:phage tail protein I [Megamonas hypermegale]
MSDKLLSPTLPASIAKDKNIQDLSNILDTTLADIRQKTELILLLPRLNELPDKILDELAYQFHVDFYRDSFSRDIKVKLIETSILSHRLKGTPYAVEKVCTDIFKSAQVVENWEYGGQPYHFKVAFIQESITDLTKINSLINAINTAKNVRSWCDEIGFITEQAGNIYFGGNIGVFDVVELNQMEYQPKDVIGESFFGGGLDIFEIQNINKGSDI